MATKNTKSAGAVRAIKVIPKRAGFRRAGREFPDGATTIPLSDLSEEQYEQLINEPMLVVLHTEIPATPEPEASPAAGE